jgi:regulator of sirC expression with transglutaminase-like and TPR domain
MDQTLHTLISLLDDHDSEVYHAVTNELLKKGLEIIPKLEKVWESTSDVKMQARLESVIHVIQFSSTRNNIKKWISEGAEDLLEGATAVAQLQYPATNYIHLKKEIDKIAADIYLSSGNHLTANEKIKLLNYVFFELNNFSRNSSNFYSPQNSFINQVLETRKGNPVSLGIIYLSVAERIGLPIYGVNLPNSFVLAYMNEFRHSEDYDLSNDVLFYINPYNKGAVLNRREIEYYIKQQKIEEQQEYFIPCDNVTIIQRLIMNLITAYEKMGFKEKMDPLKQLLVDFKVQK